MPTELEKNQRQALERAHSAFNETVSLLRRVVNEVGDPWCYSREGLDDGCLFCGSDQQRPAVYPGPTVRAAYLHRPTCVWFDIHRYLDLPVDPRHERLPS